MQRTKGIQQISEISEKFKNVDSLSSTFTNVLKGFRLSEIKKELVCQRAKELSQIISFKYCSYSPFIGVLNIRGLLLSGYSPELIAQKDAFYTFMNNPRINWRKIANMVSFGNFVLFNCNLFHLILVQ